MSSPPYRFSEFELDSSRFELRRHGRVLELERLPMDLLVLLAEKNGSVLTRQEIIERIWGKDVYIDFDHGINIVLCKIRAALRENAEGPRFIQTVSGKGYRFVAESKQDNGSAPRLGVNRSAIPQTIADQSLAVGPFQSRDMSWKATLLAAFAPCLIVGVVMAFNIAGLWIGSSSRANSAPFTPWQCYPSPTSQGMLRRSILPME